MTEEDVYEELRKKISSWPIRFPESKEAIEILSMLYTEEEAEFLTHFTAPYEDPETIEQMVNRTEKSQERIRSIVNDLVSKGLLFRFTSRKDDKVYYTLMPMAPGIFEFYFSSGRDSDEKRKVAKLIEKSYMKGFGIEVGASDYPWARVMPIEKTITINKELSKDLLILPFEKMSEFIAASRKIAVINCSCRTKKRCDHPLETCLVFDSSAEFMVERGFGRYLTVEEALELLEETEKAGLVHSTINTQTKPQFICSCCTCACLILRGLTELHNPRAIAKSNFIPVRDNEICTKCRKCVDICPLEANVYHAGHDEEPERILFVEERCIGCGLCAYHCPRDAIQMVKVRDQVPEKTPREAWMKVEVERVH